jgi:hypothetical protein
MLAAQSQDLDLASRVNVSIATDRRGGGDLIHVETGDRSLELIKQWLSPPQDIHTLTIVRPYWNPSHTVMCSPPFPQHLRGGGAQRYGRHISERGMCAHIGLRLFHMCPVLVHS